MIPQTKNNKKRTDKLAMALKKNIKRRRSVKDKKL